MTVHSRAQLQAEFTFKSRLHGWTYSLECVRVIGKGIHIIMISTSMYRKDTIKDPSGKTVTVV